MTTRHAEVRLLRADPHRWGQGRMHRIDTERDQTMCGKTPASCPGTAFLGSPEQVTCKVCLRAIESRARWQEMARQREADECARVERARRWWADYDAYLRIRALIQRCRAELEALGTLPQGARKSTGGPPSAPYWLNRAQTLFLISRAGLPDRGRIAALLAAAFIARRA